MHRFLTIQERLHPQCLQLVAHRLGFPAALLVVYCQGVESGRVPNASHRRIPNPLLRVIALKGRSFEPGDHRGEILLNRGPQLVDDVRRDPRAGRQKAI